MAITKQKVLERYNGMVKQVVDMVVSYHVDFGEFPQEMDNGLELSAFLYPDCADGRQDWNAEQAIGVYMNRSGAQVLTILDRDVSIKDLASAISDMERFDGFIAHLQECADKQKEVDQLMDRLCNINLYNRG